MSPRFEELASCETPAGVVRLWRRIEPALGVEVYEVKLGDEYLMSSLFTVGESELSRIGLAATPGDDLDVVVGGLGLGYTARVALEDPRLRSLIVVEAVGDIIDWHRRDLVPEGAALAGDPRTRFVHGDFFALSATADGFDPDAPGRRFDAILVDIDHTPRHFLAPSHATFYSPEGLAGLTDHLVPGGVFALWSNDPPDDEFVALLERVFARVEANVVTFPNFHQGREATSTIYVAVTGVMIPDPPTR